MAVIVTATLLAPAADNADAKQREAIAPGSILVGFGADTSASERHAIARRTGLQEGQPLISGADLAATRAKALTAASERKARAIGPISEFAVRPGNEFRLVAELARVPGVRFAEPDYLIESSATPNDPDLDQQWAISNTGRTVFGMPGFAGADEDVVPAWDVTTGSSDIVVAVVDTGVDYNHPDLASNIWSNPEEGLGGCPIGSHGVNTVGTGLLTCDPMDDDLQYGGHGTHVAGILGARGDDGIGVAGLNWSITMLPVKFVDAQGQGRTSDLLEGLQWLVDVKQEGVDVRVVNDSQTFVGTTFSHATSDMIDLLGANDILFVTAAGNSGEDNDDPAVRRYPCGYGRANEICVAASDSRDQLPAFANYGDETVDLAAPGKNIYSTLRDASPTDPGPNYGFISGASMAAPHVSGAAALILSTGYRSASQLKLQILDNVDPLPSLDGRVRTGGRLNVCSAIPACNPDDDDDDVPDVGDACPTLPGGNGKRLSAGESHHHPRLRRLERPFRRHPDGPFGCSMRLGAPGDPLEAAPRRRPGRGQHRDGRERPLLARRPQGRRHVLRARRRRDDSGRRRLRDGDFATGRQL